MAVGPVNKPLPLYEGGHEIDPFYEREEAARRRRERTEYEARFDSGDLTPRQQAGALFMATLLEEPASTFEEDPYYAANERYHGLPHFREVA